MIFNKNYFIDITFCNQFLIENLNKIVYKHILILRHKTCSISFFYEYEIRRLFMFRKLFEYFEKLQMAIVFAEAGEKNTALQILDALQTHQNKPQIKGF